MSLRSTVLVVDDEEQVRDLLRIILTAQDYTVVVVGHVNEAIQALNQHPNIDVIVLDVMLPDITGLQYLRSLDGDQPPVLILTALHDRDVMEKCREAGASEVITKPFIVLELLDAVRRLAELNRAQHPRQGEL